MFSSPLFAQTLVAVSKDAYTTRYYDKRLELYFSVPNNWKVVSIDIPDNKGFPAGIGLRPHDWGETATSDGNILDRSENAITIEVGNGSLGGKTMTKSSNDSEDGQQQSEDDEIPEFRTCDEIVELQHWRYQHCEFNTRLYLKGGGYYGMDTYYASTLDNRKGKCVYVSTDPLYKEKDQIHQIEISLSFR